MLLTLPYDNSLYLESVIIWEKWVVLKMSNSLWKGYIFFILNVLLTFTFIAFFYFSFTSAYSVVNDMLFGLIIILGIAAVGMGVWCFASKLAKANVKIENITIFATILTFVNLVIIIVLV